MASGHEFDSTDDPNYSPSCRVDSSSDLRDSSLLHNIESFSQDLKLLHDQHNENNPTVTQNFQSSCKQQLTPLNIPQPGNSSNEPEISQPKHHQTSENLPGMVHDRRPEIDSTDYPNYSPSCRVGSSFLHNIESFNQDLKLLHDQHNENSPSVTRNLQFSCQQQLTPLNIPQTGNSSNEPEISEPKHHQPSENLPGMVHDMRSEIRFHGNEDAVSHIQSGTESLPIQNIQSFRQDLYVPLPREVDGLQPPTTKSSDLQTLRQSESDSNKIRNMYASSYLESTINSNQDRLLLPTRGIQNQTTAIQGFFSHNRQPVENETCDRLNLFLQTLTQSPQKRHLPPSYSEHLKYKRGLYTIRHKGSQPSTSDNSCALPGNRQLPPSYSEHHFKRGSYAIPHAESQPSTSDNSCKLPGNLQLPPYSEQQFKKGSFAIPHAESQLSTSDNSCTLPGNRQLPPSHSEHRSKRGSYAVAHKESQPNTCDTICHAHVNLERLQHPYSTLYDHINRRGRGPSVTNSVRMDSFGKEKQNIRSDQESVSGTEKESVELSSFQPLNAGGHVLINILVSGPHYSTKCFLQTLAGTNELSLFPPYSLAFRRNFTRCGISMKVSVWKIDDLGRSIQFLESACRSRRSTILFALPSTKDESRAVEEMVGSLGYGRSRNIPIVLVAIKLRRPIEISEDKKSSDIGSMISRFRLKAKHNFSAYVECSVYSKEEVEAVMFTAVDVSFLCNF